MRQFNALLFLGNTEADAKVKKLKEILDGAIIMSGGLQQILTTDPMHIAGTRELEDTVRDIAAALLGRDIEFGWWLGYPGRDAKRRQPQKGRLTS